MQKEYGRELKGDSRYDAVLTGCNNPIISGYLYSKCLNCEEKGVEVEYKISIEQMKGKNRNNSVNFPRQIAIYLCRELTTESFPKIGSYSGGRNHSTIISADKKIREELNTNENLREVIKDLKRSLT